jgi:hypothetical protein
MNKLQKGVTNLLSGAFVGGFFATLLVTIGMLASAITEHSRDEWDKKHLLKEAKPAPTREEGAEELLSWLGGLAFAALAGTTVGASFVAVVGFLGGRRWEMAVSVLWGVLTGAATGILLGLTVVRGLLDTNHSELGNDFVVFARVSALVFGGCVGACNGFFFAIGVRRAMAYCVGEDQ